MVIGKGGETIRSLEADYEVQIDIEEDGTILVYATSGENGDAAIAAITALTKDPGGRRRVHRQGREDDRLRRVRRAEEGHRRAAARLERRPRPRQPHRGRDPARRRARRPRAGGRQGPRPDRPEAGRRSTRTAASSRRRSSSSGRRTPRRARPARSGRAATAVAAAGVEAAAGAAAAAARAPRQPARNKADLSRVRGGAPPRTRRLIAHAALAASASARGSGRVGSERAPLGGPPRARA